MKKSLLAAALLTCMAVSAAASTVGDTIVVEGVDKVKIETAPTEQRIVISGSKEDPQYQYIQRIGYADSSAVKRTVSSVKDFNKSKVEKILRKREDKKWSAGGFFFLGLSTMVSAPEGYSFKLWPSFEIGGGGTIEWRPFGKKNIWSLGYGIQWRNYRSSNDNYWVKTGDVMGQAPYPTGLDKRKTSLHEFSLVFPVTYAHKFNNDWKVTLGGIVNVNTGAHTKQRFEQGDIRSEFETKAIGQRPVTIDLLLKVNAPVLPELYVKYCPMKFFKDDRGPKMNQLSFGISF